MKKKIALITLIVSISVAAFAAGAMAATDIKLFINGKRIQADLQIVDGSSYVPLRVVSETLGADVKWDGDKREISITQKDFNPVAQTVAPPAKSFDVKVNVTSGPMTMNISKVTLDPAYKEYSFSEPIKAIILEAVVENTSNDTVNWYVSYGKLVTNTKEQIDGKSGAERIQHDFIGKVKRNGQIVFPVKGDLNSITSFSYVVSGPYNDGFKTYGEDKTTEIILK